MSQEPAVSAAMQILLGAGDARKLVSEAIGAIAGLDFGLAEALLADAQVVLRPAHQAHTDVIQAEAGGSEITSTALFSHAQDTMMATDSEIRMTKRLLPVFRGLDARLTALETTAGEGTR